MENQQNNILPALRSEDYLDPLQWVEKLNAQDLKQWLRNIFWLRDSLPVTVPHASRLVIEVADLLKSGSTELKTRIRVVVPQLLQEWGRDDPSDTLDHLLYICGRLRCAAAEPLIVQIASERLAGRAEEVALRRRCLAVLSGFGCTERSLHIFKQHIENIEYTAVCYRALYRYDISYAATELSEVYQIFLAEGVMDEFNIVLHTLFRDFSHARLRMEILTMFLKDSEPQVFPKILDLSRDLGVFNLEFFLTARASQRSDFIRLLLQRSSIEDIKGILWWLRSIGIELHCIEAFGDKEYIQCFYEHPETNMGEPERLFPTDDLSDELVAAILEHGEKVAIAWAATVPEEWELN